MADARTGKAISFFFDYEQRGHRASTTSLAFIQDMLNPADFVWRGNVDARSGSTVFRRPLGVTELTFYWDAVFNGVSTTIIYMALEATGDLSSEVFTRENIELSWIRLKQRFPMLAASVDELPGSECVEFVISEDSLYTVRDGEVNIIDDLQSAEDVSNLTIELQNGPPVLDNDIIAKAWIGQQKESPGLCHIFIAVAHCITDGMTGATLMREFCRELSSLSKESRIMQKSLADRLSVLLSLEALNPNNTLSPAQRRWRYAAARVIHNLRQAKFTGGHTLPQIQPVTVDRPAHSQTMVVRLPAPVTQRLIKTCGTLGITFGNALPVLSQLSQTRILYRHRRGNRANYPHMESRDEDWEYRRIQPMYYPGPISLRPYLDRSWYEGGGKSEVCVAIGFANVVLPAMPSPKPPLQVELSSLGLVWRGPLSLARWFEGSRDMDTFISDVPVVSSGESHGAYGATDIITGRGQRSKLKLGSYTPTSSSICSGRQVLIPETRHERATSLARWLEGPRDVNAFLSDELPISSREAYEPCQTTDAIHGSSLNTALVDVGRVPTFDALLSKKRFLARACLVRKQTSAQLRHPLLQELHVVRMSEACRRNRDLGLAWRATQTNQDSVKNSTSIPGTDWKTAGYVASNEGASLGNRDAIFPLEYAFGSGSAHLTSSSGRLHVRDSVVHLRCRPGELYLGALTTRGELTFFAYTDTNIYDPALVREWMEDVRAATVHYLGDGGNNEDSPMKARL
ncbi:uncharacterized protein FOMMEDRAFT_165199 [Fomitiporia mediterranea MF3/22]|uniref:uncharacterized protein n=1 Tax=Fomitiporia mediterranea (strain MF3/22) TaxID=694068 RepID=UPI0004409C5B|nr:uncharacterized protein FOMMEDRAFT_165199 [Fomitiporia mediterranea MF3/22]EJD06372.1 hypothetical protein FOMMEDRAFT_165199 [Fomitiporia mediterranea MF3/22]